MTLWRSLFLVMLAGWLSGCGINNIPTYDEQVKAAWSQVENQYQRRADLIPNLVNTVKGYASHEREVLVDVTEARAKVGSIQVDGSMLENPEKLKQFEQAQRQLGSALQRLMVVAERYPDLKANETMSQLMEELTSTENRIGFARQAFNDAVMNFNTYREQFPQNFIGGLFGSFKEAQLLKIEPEEARQAVKVTF